MEWVSEVNLDISESGGAQHLWTANLSPTAEFQLKIEEIQIHSSFPGSIVSRFLSVLACSLLQSATTSQGFLPGGPAPPELLNLKPSSLRLSSPRLASGVTSPSPQLPSPPKDSPREQGPSCKPLCDSFPRKWKLPTTYFSPGSHLPIFCSPFFVGTTQSGSPELGLILNYLSSPQVPEHGLIGLSGAP